MHRLKFKDQTFIIKKWLLHSGPGSMKLSVLVLALSSFFFRCPVSCSTNTECRTGKKINLERFTVDTNALFKNLKAIRECGETNITGIDFMRESYGNCISSLKLPLTYEQKIADFVASNFANEYDFRMAISSAASSACSDLNQNYSSLPNYISLETYRVDRLSSTIASASSTSNRFGKIVMITVTGLLVASFLFFGLIFIFYKLRRVSPKKIDFRESFVA